MRSRDLRAARTRDAYLTMEMSDRTSVISAVMFRPGPEEWSVPPGTVVTVRGAVTSCGGVRRVSVESLRPAAAFDRRDTIAAGSRREEELTGALEALLSGVEHAGLRAVLDTVFAEAAFGPRFRECPASRSRHHPYVGGLLEHTVAVASLCRVPARRYDSVDQDLLVTAALLHDVGKVDELSFDTAVDVTDAGRLLGHIVLGERIVSRAVKRAGDRLAPSLGLRLLHLVVSHHGEPEWGPPVRQGLLEAVLLHHADNLDAQAAGFMQAVAGAAVLEERWTDADNAFRRPLARPPAPGGNSCCTALRRRGLMHYNRVRREA